MKVKFSDWCPAKTVDGNKIFPILTISWGHGCVGIYILGLGILIAF